MSTDTKLHEHTVDLYKALRRNGKMMKVNGDPALVWEGTITGLTSELGIHGSYPGQAMRILKDTGSIEQAQRGSRGVYSQYIIHDPPSDQSYHEAVEGIKAAQKRVSPSKLEHELGLVKASLAGLNVSKAVSDLHEHLMALEGRIGALEAATGNELT